MSAVGFDIGSENSYIAVVKSGGIEILDNEYSLRSTPTYIGFTEKSRDIGVAAKSKLITNFENTVFGFKKLLGTKYDDIEIQTELTYLPHKVCELPSGNIGIKVKYLKNTTVFSIEQLMSAILTKLKLITESKLGNQIRDCVIAIPTYYTDAQRRAMLDAVNIAGLNAVKLINESAAVSLSYGFFKQNITDAESHNVVFVDLGKSGLITTACAFTKDKVKILGCVWDHVGGRDFDNKLVQYFVDDFKNKYNIDTQTSKKALMTLILECEQLKKVMSANSLEVRLQIECFMNDHDVSGKMKREAFEKLSEQVLSEIEKNFQRLLLKTQLKPSDIHSVEIIGGSSRIPAVKELVKKIFGHKPSETLNKDEAVARGCVLQCAILSPSLKTRDYILDDIPSYIIKISWKNRDLQEEVLELFSFSDKIPSCKLITICMSKPFLLCAFYVDVQEKLDKIGTFVLDNVPEDVEKNNIMKVKIKACLDIHGIFSIESAKLIKRNEQQLDDKNATVDNTSVDIPIANGEENISPEQLAQGVQKICAVKSYDLSIKSEVPGLTKLRLNEFINAEQQMICKDTEEKEKADARNVLEEFLYDFRAKLNNELGEFVLEKDKIAILENLNETENWFEENEDLEACEYSKKLKDLQSLSDPIFLRYTEWEQRQYIIVDYRQALQQGFDAINKVTNKESSTNVSDEDAENLLKIWENAKENLDMNVENFSQLKKVDDAPVTANELRSSLLTFKMNFQNLFSEIQRKERDLQKTLNASSGDGLDENSGNSDQDNLPNDS